MDLLDSILNSMQKPPSATDAQKAAMKKQKEAMEKSKIEERNYMIKFRHKMEEKVEKFLKDNKTSLPFEPMDLVYRSVLREVAEAAGLQVFSFGEDGIDRYSVLYKKENGPSEDEITVRRAGGVWDEEKAIEMADRRFEMERQEAMNLIEEKNRKRKGNEISGTFYKQKYAHLIGEDAALNAAHKTNMNKNYGEVPSENKKDLRSIEQTMADIKAKKMKRIETATTTSE